MLFKILTVLPILSICVKGTASDHEPRHAVSTQSYHRDDVPLSYKFTSVHIYTTPRPEQKPSHHQHKNHQENQKFLTLQYAPLEQSNYQNNIHRYKHIPDQTDEHKHVIQQIPEEFQYSTEENGKQHLEPRVEAKYLDVHNQNYRSYVPGHNIEVLQSNRVRGQNDLYRPYHNNLQNQKVKIPTFVIHRKPEQYVEHTENLRAAEQRPLSEEHKVLYTFLPRPIVNTQHNSYALEKPFTSHQALSAKIPRLHLNIARVYGIAHVPQQAPSAPTYINRPDIEKPPSHTQAIFLPIKTPTQQKTILYPVQDTNKNYPVHT